MIIFTPVDLPIIEPDDWDKFWEIWNAHSSRMKKINASHDASTADIGRDDLWIGLDIFKRYDIPLSWVAPYFDIKYALPKLYAQILNTGLAVHTVRLIQSQKPFFSHTDEDKDKWEIRAFFHHPSEVQQWYFTKPFDVDGERTYINMPKSTNWFMYNDKHAWHGTDFTEDKKKILLQFFAFRTPAFDELLSKSINAYKSFTLEY